MTPMRWLLAVWLAMGSCAYAQDGGDAADAGALSPPSGSDSADSAPAGSDPEGGLGEAPRDDGSPSSEYYSAEELNAPAPKDDEPSAAPAAKAPGKTAKRAAGKRGAKKGAAAEKAKGAAKVDGKKAAPKAAAAPAVVAVPLTPVAPFNP